ncbi:MAG: hypothetical protein Q7R78_00990 [bacterium]|nr:hypothetical protein [bacterium]
MKEFLKKNFAIILAFLLPIILIVVVAISTYFPSLFISTDYNFVYTSCTDGRNYYPYNCETYLQKRYSVEGNKITLNTVDLKQDLNKDGVPDFNQNYTDRIFLHDTKKNESREITLKEAESLDLSGLLTSPDGVTVSSYYSRSGDFFPFGGSSSYGYYLTKGKSRSKLNLINTNDQYYYQNNFQFVGWVLPLTSKVE